MKLLQATLLSLFIITATSHAADAIKLQPQKPAVEKNEYLYEIKDKEIIINDKLITLFAFSKDGISVSYRNKTDKAQKPKYIFKAYNQYGMLVGVCDVGNSIVFFGPSTRMEPGAVSSEKLHLKPFPLDEILKYANIQIPTDLKTMKWVVLSKTNSK
jgi:hypothetical protein